MVNRKTLTYEQRLGLLHFLLERRQNNSLERRALANGAAFISVTKVTVTRLWQQFRFKHENALNGGWDVTSGN
jgi:hypothetical protein